jgi:hypothetical protein
MKTVAARATRIPIKAKICRSLIEDPPILGPYGALEVRMPTNRMTKDRNKASLLEPHITGLRRMSLPQLSKCCVKKHFSRRRRNDGRHHAG